MRPPLAALAVLFALAATPALGDAPAPDLASRLLVNPAPYIPPQCYTRTLDADGRTHNPCFVCHTASTPPNYVNDEDLQQTLTFPGPAQVNPWANLFAGHDSGDSEAAILAYVRTDNYKAADGRLILADRLKSPPPGWDFDGDGRWSGFVPDAFFAFDETGFDRTPDGRPTGWRAFAYYPFPGTFWPTNGSTDDVLIRLPEAFRNDESGRYDAAVYGVNLAIVEAVVRGRDVAIAPTDETALGVDLDKDGRLATARKIAFDWAPLRGRAMSYVGAARLAQRAGRVHLARGLFPEGTEFLHSVRYIDVGDDGTIRLAPRLKELRYARKREWVTYAALEEMAMHEIKEGDDFPDRLRTVSGNVEQGVANGAGWTYQGFIEDTAGELRPQTYEESVFCVGCHGGVGATADGIFSYPRRFDQSAFRGGWYHWSQKGLDGVAEPRRADGRYEYTTYLREVGGADEFRANREALERFFAADGLLKPAMAEALHDDISLLLFPSRGRALALDRAYRAIVREQSFAKGRDAVLGPIDNVLREVEEDQATGITEPLSAR